MSVWEWVLLIVVLAITIPFCIYLTVKLARYAWLEASHRFKKDHEKGTL